jgi:hypothetical protein
MLKLLQGYIFSVKQVRVNVFFVLSTVSDILILIFPSKFVTAGLSSLWQETALEIVQTAIKIKNHLFMYCVSNNRQLYFSNRCIFNTPNRKLKTENPKQ